MNALLVLAIFLVQQPVPTLEEIVAKIEEKNQGLGPFEAEIVGETNRGLIWGDGKTFVAWDIVSDCGGVQSFLSRYDEGAEAAYKMAEMSKGSGMSVVARAYIVGSFYRTWDEFPEMLIFDATLMPRAFFKGTWEVREYKAGDVIGYALTKNLQSPLGPESKERLTYFVSSADWRIRAVEWGTDEPLRSTDDNDPDQSELELGTDDLWRTDVREFGTFNGVKVPTMVGGWSVRFRSLRTVAEVARPYWAKMDDLPPLMPGTGEELREAVERESSFTNCFKLANALALDEVPEVCDSDLSEYEQLKEVLQKGYAKRQDCPSFNEALALTHWALGEKEDFWRVAKGSGSPLLAWVIAESEEKEGHLEEALRWVELMPASGYYAVLRQEMGDRLRLRLCKDVDTFVTTATAALAHTRLEALEPVPQTSADMGGSEIKVETKPSLGIFDEKSDEFCLEAIAYGKDERMRLLVARHWLKQGEFAKADEQYAALSSDVLKGLGDEPSVVIKNARGLLPRFATRMAREHPEDILFLAGALLGALDPSDAPRVEELIVRLMDRLRAMKEGESLPDEAGGMIARAATRLFESKRDVATHLLKASLARLRRRRMGRSSHEENPRSVLETGHVKAIRRVGGDVAGQCDLVLSSLYLDEGSLRWLEIDPSVFRQYVRERLSSGSAAQNVYETLAMLVRRTRNEDGRKFSFDGEKEDIRLLQKYAEQFPTAWWVFETLGDYAFTNEQPAEAASWYARALISQLDQEAWEWEYYYTLNPVQEEWRMDKSLALKAAIAFSQAKDSAGGLSLFERVRTHPRLKEWRYAEDHLLDMLLLLDTERCFREAAASYAKRPATARHLLGALRREKRWVETYAWCESVNYYLAQKMHIQALLALAQETAPRTELAPELLASVDEEARTKMKAIATQFVEWSQGEVLTRRAVAARELATVLGEAEKERGKEVIDALIDLVRRLGTVGRRDEAWAVLDHLEASHLGPLLWELAGENKKAFYEHARLHCWEGTLWLAYEQLGAEEVLEFALEAAKTPEGIQQDFRCIAAYVRAYPREREDLGAILRKGVERFPDDDDLWEAMGDDAYAGGRYSEALDAFVRVAASRYRFGSWDSKFKYRSWSEVKMGKYHPLSPLPYKIAVAAEAAGKKEKGVETLRTYYRRLVKKLGGGCTDGTLFYEIFAASFELLGENAAARGIAIHCLPEVALKAVLAVGGKPEERHRTFLSIGEERFVLAFQLMRILEREGRAYLAWVVVESIGAGESKEELEILRKTHAKLGDRSDELLAWFLGRAPTAAESDLKEADRLVAIIRASGLEERETAAKSLMELGRVSPLALKAHLDDIDVEVRSRVKAALLPVAKEGALRAILEEGKDW